MTQLVTALISAVAEHHSLVTPHIPDMFTSVVCRFLAFPLDQRYSSVKVSGILEPESHRHSGSVPCSLLWQLRDPCWVPSRPRTVSHVMYIVLML